MGARTAYRVIDSTEWLHIIVMTQSTLIILLETRRLWLAMVRHRGRLLRGVFLRRAALRGAGRAKRFSPRRHQPRGSGFMALAAS